jgi:hypothetical protein
MWMFLGLEAALTLVIVAVQRRTRPVVGAQDSPSHP